MAKPKLGWLSVQGNATMSSEVVDALCMNGKGPSADDCLAATQRGFVV